MSQTPSHTIPGHPWQEPTGIYPPRFRWLKRGAILFVVTLLALAGLRWGWGKIADDRLAAMIAEAHARGEPILPEDFQEKPIPDSENAAVTLRLAAGSLVCDNEFYEFEKLYMGGELTPTMLGLAHHIASVNQKSLQLCRQARSQANADWNVQIVHPTIAMRFPYLQPQRELANVQEDVALADHAEGNDFDAVEQARGLLHQADIIDLGPPSEIIHLVAMGMNEMETSLLGKITPDLQIEGSTNNKRANLPCTRKQVRDLIVALLDEELFAKCAVWHTEGERMGDLDTGAFTANCEFRPSTFLVDERNGYSHMNCISPMIELDAVRLAVQATSAVYAFETSNWPAASEHLSAPQQRSEVNIESLTRFYSEMRSVSYDKVVRFQFQSITERRVAAIALAIRLFRVDHSGKYPVTLENLVPGYLPAVPLDPMAVGNRTLQYRPERTPPVVYSVGPDGVDNGGQFTPDYNPWMTPDAVFSLEPAARDTETSPQTQDHQ